MRRRRIPPPQSCADPQCGFAWRGWSTACPACASRLPLEPQESLRAYRQRTLDPERNAGAGESGGFVA